VREHRRRGQGQERREEPGAPQETSHDG
jgi:hypothetical protein